MRHLYGVSIIITQAGTQTIRLHVCVIVDTSEENARARAIDNVLAEYPPHQGWRVYDAVSVQADAAVVMLNGHELIPVTAYPVCPN